jgi:hypothetical protein
MGRRLRLGGTRGSSHGAGSGRPQGGSSEAAARVFRGVDLNGWAEGGRRPPSAGAWWEASSAICVDVLFEELGGGRAVMWMAWAGVLGFWGSGVERF